MADNPNAAQIDYWNATAGETWSTMHDQLDRQIAPLGLEAMRRLLPQPGEQILDIGCGCGQTTVALAERVGRAGAVMGVDISRPMLEVARERPLPPEAAQPTFREADAQSDDLGESVFDAAFSRFGVMFFSDPVAAFTNIRAALKPSGRLVFVCWRPYPENLWMRIPMEAAQPLLAPAAPADPTAPGPFAFADPERVRSILGQAGFTAVTIERHDTRIGGGDIDQTVALAFRVGPLGRALQETPDRLPEVAKAVKAAITPFDTPRGVLMPAAVWIVQARAG